jgi:hypothetical protein
LQRSYMRVAFILVLAWLVTVPAAGAASFRQDTPAASSTQPPASAPADSGQNAPMKAEPPAAEQAAPDSAAKKANTKTQGAPARKIAKRRRIHRKSAPKPTPAGQPRKIVVRQGGAIEPSAQIAPGMAPQEADQQRQHAVELLASTEENLKQLSGRMLDTRQQETVAQIHNYADGARSALKDGDTQRAHTLALKAHLLADDLVRH